MWKTFPLVPSKNWDKSIQFHHWKIEKYHFPQKIYKLSCLSLYIILLFWGNKRRQNQIFCTLTFGHLYWNLVSVLHYLTVNYMMSCCFLTLYIYVTYVASCSTFLFWENYDQMTSLGKGWQKMENKWFLIWCQVIVFSRLKHVLSLWFPLC